MFLVMICISMSLTNFEIQVEENKGFHLEKFRSRKPRTGPPVRKISKNSS